jgi:hypothetical protein
MNKNPTSTPVSSAAKSMQPPAAPGAKPHWKQSWGAGNKPSHSPVDNLFASGANAPGDFSVTPDDIRRLVEMSRERHPGR